MTFALFMSSPAGRILRVVAGAALIAVGVVLQAPALWVAAPLGAVVFLAGAFDVCVVAPFLRLPWTGRAIRARAVAAAGVAAE